MKNLKYVMSVILSISLILLSGTAVFAKDNEKMEMLNKLGYSQLEVNEIYNQPESNSRLFSKFKNIEMKKFIEFGFTKEEIADFTEVDLEYLRNKTGNMVGVDEKYYRVTAEGKSVELDKNTALKEVENYSEMKKLKELETSETKSFASSEIGSDTEQKSWMRMTTTVTKDTSQSPVAYYFKNSFEWLTEPVYVLEDGIGISHGEYATHIQNSEIFKYTYDRHTNDVSKNYIDTTSSYKWTADDKNINGMAFKYDLLGSDFINGNKVIVQKSRGYMLFGATRSNPNYSTGAIYGHYTHTQIAINFSIGVKISLNSLSVSGAVSTDKMTDTGVTFTF